MPINFMKKNILSALFTMISQNLKQGLGEQALNYLLIQRMMGEKERSNDGILFTVQVTLNELAVPSPS